MNVLCTSSSPCSPQTRGARWAISLDIRDLVRRRVGGTGKGEITRAQKLSHRGGSRLEIRGTDGHSFNYNGDLKLLKRISGHRTTSCGARGRPRVVSFIPILPYLVSIFGSLVARLLGALPQRPRLGIGDICRRAFTYHFLVLFRWTKPAGMSVPIVPPSLQETHLAAPYKDRTGKENRLPKRPTSYLVTSRSGDLTGQDLHPVYNHQLEIRGQQSVIAGEGYGWPSNQLIIGL
ncbi:hypothetical protein E2C01_049655 [Portunus trituberculatus]|uniref:Uncharacterized protein n=1 Tax=Portunus trituberculatus TaxID=210409 RepID=A0A5B7G669_PORTR|nr:hypothetical protein [Portunus trituberculatus]